MSTSTNSTQSSNEASTHIPEVSFFSQFKHQKQRKYAYQIQELIKPHFWNRGFEMISKFKPNSWLFMKFDHNKQTMVKNEDLTQFYKMIVKQRNKNHGHKIIKFGEFIHDLSIYTSEIAKERDGCLSQITKTEDNIVKLSNNIDDKITENTDEDEDNSYLSVKLNEEETLLKNLKGAKDGLTDEINNLLKPFHNILYDDKMGFYENPLEGEIKKIIINSSKTNADHSKCATSRIIQNSNINPPQLRNMISTKFKDWGRHSISAFENRKEEPGRFFLDFSISVENEIFHSSSYEENIPRNLPSKEIIEGILNGKGRETYEEKWGYIGLLCNTPGVLMMKQYFIGKMGENTQLSMETNNLHQEVSTHIDLIGRAKELFNRAEVEIAKIEYELKDFGKVREPQENQKHPHIIDYESAFRYLSSSNYKFGRIANANDESTESDVNKMRMNNNSRRNNRNIRRLMKTSDLGGDKPDILHSNSKRQRIIKDTDSLISHSSQSMDELSNSSFYSDNDSSGEEILDLAKRSSTPKKTKALKRKFLELSPVSHRVKRKDKRAISKKRSSPHRKKAKLNTNIVGGDMEGVKIRVSSGESRGAWSGIREILPSTHPNPFQDRQIAQRAEGEAEEHMKQWPKHKSEGIFGVIENLFHRHNNLLRAIKSGISNTYPPCVPNEDPILSIKLFLTRSPNLALLGISNLYKNLIMGADNTFSHLKSQIKKEFNQMMYFLYKKELAVINISRDVSKLHDLFRCLYQITTPEIFNNLPSNKIKSCVCCNLQQIILDIINLEYIPIYSRLIYSTTNIQHKLQVLELNNIFLCQLTIIDFCLKEYDSDKFRQTVGHYLEYILILNGISFPFESDLNQNVIFHYNLSLIRFIVQILRNNKISLISIPVEEKANNSKNIPTENCNTDNIISDPHLLKILHEIVCFWLFPNNFQCTSEPISELIKYKSREDGSPQPTFTYFQTLIHQGLSISDTITQKSKIYLEVRNILICRLMREIANSNELLSALDDPNLRQLLIMIREEGHDYNLRIIYYFEALKVFRKYIEDDLSSIIDTKYILDIITGALNTLENTPNVRKGIWRHIFKFIPWMLRNLHLDTNFFHSLTKAYILWVYKYNVRGENLDIGVFKSAIRGVLRAFQGDNILLDDPNLYFIEGTLLNEVSILRLVNWIFAYVPNLIKQFQTPKEKIQNIRKLFTKLNLLLPTDSNESLVGVKSLQNILGIQKFFLFFIVKGLYLQFIPQEDAFKIVIKQMVNKIDLENSIIEIKKCVIDAFFILIFNLFKQANEITQQNCVQEIISQLIRVIERIFYEFQELEKQIKYRSINSMLNASQLLITDYSKNVYKELHNILYSSLDKLILLAPKLKGINGLHFSEQYFLDSNILGIGLNPQETCQAGLRQKILNVIEAVVCVQKVPVEVGIVEEESEFDIDVENIDQQMLESEQREILKMNYAKTLCFALKTNLKPKLEKFISLNTQRNRGTTQNQYHITSALYEDAYSVLGQLDGFLIQYEELKWLNLQSRMKYDFAAAIIHPNIKPNLIYITPLKYFGKVLEGNRGILRFLNHHDLCTILEYPIIYLLKSMVIPYIDIFNLHIIREIKQIILESGQQDNLRTKSKYLLNLYMSVPDSFSIATYCQDLLDLWKLFFTRSSRELYLHGEYGEHTGQLNTFECQRYLQFLLPLKRFIIEAKKDYHIITFKRYMNKVIEMLLEHLVYFLEHNGLKDIFEEIMRNIIPNFTASSLNDIESSKLSDSELITLLPLLMKAYSHKKANQKSKYSSQISNDPALTYINQLSHYIIINNKFELFEEMLYSLIYTKHQILIPKISRTLTRESLTRITNLKPLPASNTSNLQNMINSYLSFLRQIIKLEYSIKQGYSYKNKKFLGVWDTKYTSKSELNFSRYYLDLYITILISILVSHQKHYIIQENIYLDVEIKILRILRRVVKYLGALRCSLPVEVSEKLKILLNLCNWVTNKEFIPSYNNFSLNQFDQGQLIIRIIEENLQTRNSEGTNLIHLFRNEVERLVFELRKTCDDERIFMVIGKFCSIGTYTIIPKITL